MSSLSDEALIEGYLTARDQKQLNELFERYYERVAAWCYRIAGDRETAADLAQEIFVKVQRGLVSFQGTAKFGTWLYSIARNHCFNALRSRSVQPSFLGSDALDPLIDLREADAYVQFERKADGQLLRDLMEQSLDKVEIEVMTLHYFDELPLDAISRLLRLSNPSGAKAYVVSAKRKLQTAFSGARSQSRPPKV